MALLSETDPGQQLCHHASHVPFLSPADGAEERAEAVGKARLQLIKILGESAGFLRHPCRRQFQAGTIGTLDGLLETFGIVGWLARLLPHQPRGFGDVGINAAAQPRLDTRDCETEGQVEYSAPRSRFELSLRFRSQLAKLA